MKDVISHNQLLINQHHQCFRACDFMCVRIHQCVRWFGVSTNLTTFLSFSFVRYFSWLSVFLSLNIDTTISPVHPILRSVLLACVLPPSLNLPLHHLVSPWLIWSHSHKPHFLPHSLATLTRPRVTPLLHSKTFVSPILLPLPEIDAQS